MVLVRNRDSEVGIKNAWALGDKSLHDIYEGVFIISGTGAAILHQL
jgi:hypothetical protein